MSSSKDDSTPLINHLKSISASSHLISYKTFIQEVLFAPNIGYYTKERHRVGRNPQTDFYTAESLGPVFKKLLLTSIQKLLADDNHNNLKEFNFVEIGPEPGQGLYPNQDTNHPFLNTLSFQPNQPIKIPPLSIVFANELLDAQPFHRLIYKDNHWHELGVKILPNNTLIEELLPQPSPEIKAILHRLPIEVAENYHLDLPLPAENLLESIAKQNWKGLIILFDYGLSWPDLIHNHPQGTARAYYKHKQHNNLLTNIGNQDITCHICWDPLINILKKYHFSTPTLQRQESFFVHNAIHAIEQIINTKLDNKNIFNYDKQTLNELIHPAHMGHKFQVLWAKR